MQVCASLLVPAVPDVVFLVVDSRYQFLKQTEYLYSGVNNICRPLLLTFFWVFDFDLALCIQSKHWSCISLDLLQSVHFLS